MAGDDAQTRITSFWNMVAPGYEEHEGNVVASGTPEHDLWVAGLRTFLPDPPADVLDVGTGTGFTALIAASLGHRVTGIDLAPRMLDAARRHAARRQLEVTFVRNDAVAPDFPHETFDVVTNRHLLWTLREPLVAFRNWLALLRPRGLVVAIDGLHFGPRDIGAGAESDLDAGPFEQHYTAEARAQLPFMHIGDPTPVIDAFGAAGFVEVSTTVLPELAHPATPDVAPYVVIARRPA